MDLPESLPGPLYNSTDMGIRTRGVQHGQLAQAHSPVAPEGRHGFPLKELDRTTGHIMMGSEEAQGAVLGLSAMGSVPDPDVGLPSTHLVGARTIHRSSFHIWKVSETQPHSQSWFFIIRAFSHLFKLPT